MENMFKLHNLSTQDDACKRMPLQSRVQDNSVDSQSTWYPKSRVSTNPHMVVKKIPESDKDPHIMVAIFDYNAKTNKELSLRKGEKALRLDNYSDKEWVWLEKVVDRSSGYVPYMFVAVQGSMEAQQWFARNVSRKDSERLLLLEGNPGGTFLIRKCESSKDAFSISIRDRQTVNHYRIKHMNDRYCITRRNTFTTLEELVVFYSSNSQGLCCQLTLPCPRPAPVTYDLSVITKDHWEISRTSINLLEKLGDGHFGEVYKGTWNNVVTVAVKTLKPGTTSKEDFLKEAKILKNLNHPKLVKLYAVCSDDPMYIITELMTGGSLLDHLRSYPGRQLDTNSLVNMIAQIASGMAYLEYKRCIHRDLAARNILVGENNVCKVADFGLARMVIDNNHTYEAKKGSQLPIKWTAPDAAFTGRFTIKSDIWSFGIVIYEIITYGGVPYPLLNNSETLSQLEAGYRMPIPSKCSQEIYSIMLMTWEANPNDRPTFQYLLNFFEDINVN